MKFTPLETIGKQKKAVMSLTGFNLIEKKDCKKNSQRGFSLVEIVVASLLLALICTGVFSVILSSRKLITTSHRRHFATIVAQTALENLRAYLGAEYWDNASYPINPGFLGGFGNWSVWHNITTDNFLNISNTFGNSEFATKYKGKWRYKLEDELNFDYRKAVVEVNWTEIEP